MKWDTRRNITALIFILIITGFYFIYSDVKQSITQNTFKLNNFLEQQTRKKSDSFMEIYLSDLRFLTSFPDIIYNTGNYKNIIQKYYNQHKKYLKAVTRLDQSGKIIYTYPYTPEAIGKDVSSQKHNQYVMKYHKPVLSDTFKTVQGYEALALVFPVFSNKKYNGALSLLINFSELNKDVYNILNIDKESLSISIDKTGKIYYWTGKAGLTNSINFYVKHFKTFQNFLKKVYKNESGTGVFRYYDSPRKKIITYFASFHTINFHDITRKIIIARPYSKIFSFMYNITFKILILGLFIILTTMYFLKIIFDNNRKIMNMKFQLEKEETENKMQRYVRSIIDSMPAGIIGLNLNKEIVLWNKQIQTMTETDFETVKNKYIFDSVKNLAFLEKTVDTVLQTHQPISVNRIKQYIKRTYYFNFTVFPLTEENRVSNIIIIVNDITDVMKNEQKLMQVQKIEMIGNMSAGIAHDMNNILGGIVAGIDLLKLSIEQKQDENKMLDYIKILEDSTNRATGIVKQLLSLSKKDTLVLEQFDINRSITEVINFCKASFPKNITIHFQEATGPCAVKGDKIQIEQALLNILINCSHALTIMVPPGKKQGGDIHINIQKIQADIYFQQTHPKSSIDKYYQISISDNGVGMDDITKAQIFDPFFTTKSKDRGSGLGLNMVMNIISRHKGFITVYSEKGRGTTFNIYLPCSSETISAAEIEENKKENQKEGIIFIVDDEILLRRVIKTILEKAGYTVLTAESGEKALIIYKKNYKTIDAVILDMSLTGITGIETFQKMKAINSAIKAVLASGFLPDERIQEALELGIKDFIAKPFNRRQILETLQKIL